MGLVYNHKDKSGLVVLTEENLENGEGELPGFVILPDSETEEEVNTDNIKLTDKNRRTLYSLRFFLLLYDE